MGHGNIHNDKLAERVGRLHMQQRLDIERNHVKQIFGRGRNFFHIENWYSASALMRLCFRLVGLYGRGRRNAANIRVRENEIFICGLPSGLNGFTILQLSDLHLGMHDAITRALIKRVQEVEYDLCVLTGDFCARTYGPFEAVLQGIAKLKSSLKGTVLGILGNHDFIEMVPGLEKLGIRMLLNEATVIEHNHEKLFIAGVDDPHYYQVDNLEKAASTISPEAISILLSHSPEIYRQAAHADFNLMLSGHTHGGQICLPGGFALTYNIKAPRHVGRGSWQYHDMQGYTSVGCGVCAVDVRFNCPPEITLHRLRCAK
jgi:predicted MPP superfamily phosphohydrolase